MSVADRTENVAPITLTPPAWVPVVFFASGFAALTYQVVWQRILYAAFGVNIEAVTVVVTAFLAGLGVGSLAGGLLAQAAPRRLLRTFALIEASVGAFGLLSAPFFRYIGTLTLDLSSVSRGAITALIVMLPTSLMGATLPVLVAFMVRTTGNVGRSVALLYFVNTAGSALAAFACALVLLRSLGEQGTIDVAVATNLLVAGGALICSLQGGVSR